MKIIRNAIRKWLGVEVIERKVAAHNKDILTIMEYQMMYKEQYPLRDPLQVTAIDVETGQVKK
jgi:hypothetical protein